jgi:hypothetical protein
MSKIQRDKTPSYWYSYDTPLYGNSKINLAVNHVYLELQRNTFPPLYERVVNKDEFLRAFSHRNNLVIESKVSPIEGLSLLQYTYTLNGRKESKPFYKSAIVFHNLVLIQNRVTTESHAKMIEDLFNCYNNCPDYLFDFVRRVYRFLDSCKTQLEVRLLELNIDIDTLRSSEDKWPRKRT